MKNIHSLRHLRLCNLSKLSTIDRKFFANFDQISAKFRKKCETEVKNDHSVLKRDCVLK